MKKLVVPIMFIAIIVGIYEQTQAKPNIYIIIAAVVVFMYGMMQLSARTPSKHIDTDNENEEEDANEGR
jgi:Na+/H+-dicarboxylate symporter